MKRALILCLALLAGASGAAEAVVDSFYENRMQSGIRAFEEGNWEQAAHQLRIACFGHLDEPVALGEGLIRLAVVEARLGDEDAFRRTFARLVELEERFSSYSSARVPASVRQQFEELAGGLIPLESLRTAAGFQAIAERAEAQRIARMPPGERRAELERRLQAEPERTDWLLAMARLELEVRRPRPALEWLARLPPETADAPPATCLRQQAASESGDCAATDLAQAFCPGVPPGVVEFRLQCLVDAGRWPEASALISELDPELRAKRRIARLERRVQKNSGGDGAQAATAAETTVANEPPSMPGLDAAAPVPPPAAVEPTEGPSGEAELAGLRRRLEAATTGAELAALGSEAEGLADRRPALRGARLLAAEIAYLRSDWPRAVAHFERAGDLGPDETRLAFYLAVALYESGRRADAAQVLRPVAPRLERTDFVDAYVDRILAPGI